VDDASEMRLQISRQRFVAARRNPEPYRPNVSGTDQQTPISAVSVKSTRQGRREQRKEKDAQNARWGMAEDVVFERGPGGVGGVVEDDRSKDGDSAGAERVADESDLVGVRQTMENLTQPELRVHVLCPGTGCVV